MTFHHWPLQRIISRAVLTRYIIYVDFYLDDCWHIGMTANLHLCKVPVPAALAAPPPSPQESNTKSASLSSSLPSSFSTTPGGHQTFFCTFPSPLQSSRSSLWHRIRGLWAKLVNNEFIIPNNGFLTYKCAMEWRWYVFKVGHFPIYCGEGAGTNVPILQLEGGLMGR